MKRLIRRLHAYLALICGLVILAVATSGAALVFRPEIDAVLRPNIEWDPAKTLSWQRAVDRGTALRPDHRLQMVWFPNQHRPYFQLAYEKDGVEYTASLYLHPNSGAPIAFESSELMGLVEEFHENLLLGDFGSFLVRWCSLAFGVILLTGLWLWWPGWRFKRWFAPQHTLRSRFARHAFFGWTSSLFLLAMVASGAIWSFPSQLEPLVYRLFGDKPPATAPGELWQLRSREPLPGETRIDPQRFVERALDAAPSDAFLYYLTFPILERESVQVRLQRGYTPFPQGESYVYYFDAYSGELLGANEPAQSSAARFLGRWNAALHFGSFGGLPTRLIYFACCAVVLYLGLSGVRLFIARKGRQRPNAVATSEEDRPADS